MEPLKLEPVAPVGVVEARALGDWRDKRGKRQGGIVEVSLPRYPEETVFAGRKLQLLRRGLGLSVPQAASRFGVRALEVVYLEQGQFRCDYEEAERRLCEKELGR